MIIRLRPPVTGEAADDLGEDGRYAVGGGDATQLPQEFPLGRNGPGRGRRGLADAAGGVVVASQSALGRPGVVRSTAQGAADDLVQGPGEPGTS